MFAHEKLIAAWLRKAEHDIGTARAAAEKEFYDTACYHCQQSAEKIVKGFLVKYLVEFEKIHDLESLFADAAQFNASWLKYKDQAIALTRFAVEVRYPSDDEPTMEDYTVAIKCADEIMTFARPLLQSSNQE